MVSRFGLLSLWASCCIGIRIVVMSVICVHIEMWPKVDREGQLINYALFTENREQAWKRDLAALAS